MIFKFVAETHPLRALKPSEELPLSARQFWERSGVEGCDRAVAAYHRGELVGFFRFWWTEPIRHSNGILQAAGTWVCPQFRREGLAYKMWQWTLSRLPVNVVHVCTISKGGSKLIKSLQGDFPHIDWDVV